MSTLYGRERGEEPLRDLAAEEEPPHAPRGVVSPARGGLVDHGPLKDGAKPVKTGQNRSKPVDHSGGS